MDTSGESAVNNGGEKESDKLLTSHDGDQNETAKSFGTKKENLTVSTASHSSLSRDVPQLKVTEDGGGKVKASAQKRVLKVAVTVMFLIMAVGVIVIWSLHDGSKNDKQAMFFFFHAEDLYLKSDTDLGKTSIEGTMGGQLFVVPEPPYREKDYCASDAKWCFKWKENTILNVDYVDKNNMKCMTVSWKNITSICPTDCYELKIGFWYGMGGQDIWPMHSIAQQYYLPGYDTQHKNVYEFYLLSSHGTSIYITSEDPFILSFNESESSKLCISPAAVGPGSSTSLEYSVCQSNTIRNTHAAMAEMSHRKSDSNEKYNVTSYDPFSWEVGNPEEILNVSKLTNFLDNLIKEGYTCGTVEIGFKWEKNIGDFEIDVGLLKSLNVLKNYKCTFILPVSPVISYLSKMFNIGIKGMMFIQDTYQKSVRLYRYHGIQGALIDMSKKKHRAVITDKLKSIASKIDIAGFKLRRIPVSVHTSDSEGGRFVVSEIYRGWIQAFNDVGKVPVLQNVYRSQDKPLLIEVTSLVETKSVNHSCLENPLPTVFTLGLDGYPYLLSTLSNNNLTSELVIRWLQYSVFFTGLTIPSEALDMNLARFLNKADNFRDSFTLPMMKSLQPDISSHQPILLPLWWYYSRDQNVFTITDQFLFNETILIAPIFCEGQTTRDIYLPEIDGIWSHSATGKDYIGKKWLKNFSVGLDEFQYFRAKMLY